MQAGHFAPRVDRSPSCMMPLYHDRRDHSRMCRPTQERVVEQSIQTVASYLPLGSQEGEAVPIELGEAVPIELGEADPVEVDEVVHIEMAEAVPIELSEVVPIELAEAAPIESAVDHRSASIGFLKLLCEM